MPTEVKEMTNAVRAANPDQEVALRIRSEMVNLG